MNKFGQKFCSKHPLKQEGDIVPIPQEHIDAGKKGASGNLSVIGGAGKLALKTLFNNAKSGFKQLFGGGGSATIRTGGGFRPLVTGNKIHTTKSINEAFKNRFIGPSKPASTVTGSFFNAPNQYIKKAVKPPNYKKHVA